jgi:hypothetical protein
MTKGTLIDIKFPVPKTKKRYTIADPSNLQRWLTLKLREIQKPTGDNKVTPAIRAINRYNQVRGSRRKFVDTLKRAIVSMKSFAGVFLRGFQDIQKDCNERDYDKAAEDSFKLNEWAKSVRNIPIYPSDGEESVNQ